MREKKTDDAWLVISDEDLDVNGAIDFLHTAEAGAIDVFIGTTRQWTRGRETADLAYECYAGMAIREMERLVFSAKQRWPVLKASLFHRIGRVPIAQASVVIGVATPHRSDAFEACRFLIDALKKDVPIWKYETYVDGSGAWVGAMGEQPQ